ncbi:transmembrane protein 179B-like [Engraulis encrasicolus]|uniref:transmembrane protein 179B-like n=1 Tax=Engraulis encrasicolus TaxID=184585 RepID=UPI002FD14B98
MMCLLLSFFLLITGCVLKIGTDQLCHSLPPTLFHRCEDAQDVHWTMPNSGHQFYTHLHSAELCVWVSLCFLLVSGFLACLPRGDGGGPGETSGGPVVSGPSLGYGSGGTSPFTLGDHLPSFDFDFYDSD